MKIFITGITGQDGIFISKFFEKNFVKYEIIGTSRSFNKQTFENKARQNFRNLKIINIDLLNYTEVNKFITDFKPKAVLNLTGPSSVYNSLINKSHKDEITKIFDNVTNSLIENKNFCNFFQASTSEMFGSNSEDGKYSESNNFSPNSPYAHGKLKNHKKVLQLRNEYNWNIFSGIMFNHESEFRSSEYLFMKVINTAIKIKNNEANKLTVGSLDICRDWSYAEEVAKGIFEITFNGTSYDYVLGSGEGSTIRDLINIVFDYFDLDFDKYVKIDQKLLRKNDPEKIISNPLKIKTDLGWSTNLNFEEIVIKIIENYLNLNKK